MAWETKRVFIVVKTYPNPAHKGIEVSCTAAITETERSWMRLFPVPFRLLDEDKQFPRYSWIDVKVQKASDSRPESFNLNAESIQIVRQVGTHRDWRERRDLILPLKRHCLCCIKQEQKRDGQRSPTLGIFKPASIDQFSIVPCAPGWTAEEKAILSQQGFGFLKTPNVPLQKVPFDFKYRFRCPEETCNGHEAKCLDWEIYQAYREWRKRYGADWQTKMREKFERDMIQRDTHFFVGTFRAHPQEWGIVGLFYPPYEQQRSMF